MKFLVIVFGFCFFSVVAYSQIDTAFWFAAPNASSAFNYDRPIYLRMTSYQNPATVIISQPANAGFIPITLSLPAYTTQSTDLTAFINNIECTPGDVVQNRGLKITSSTRIAAYYEVNAFGPNPELFALKGKNALGSEFYISSQYILGNSPVLTPTPISSFNIVASEDNTIVTIIPTNNIAGHPANISFNISLNKGQTYAAVATSTLAAGHLQGSHVTSTKPIAITVADDLLQGTAFGGPCEDLAGDQTVPVNVLGTEYIAIKGELNFPYDKVYITATQNGTVVKQDGITVITLNAGQSKELTVSNAATYIQTSLPAYAYQLTGVGCEVGSAVLPKIQCTGSSSVSVSRSSNEPLWISLLIKNGGQGSFLLNNNLGIITAGQFAPVPATGGQWYFAKIPLSLSSYPNNSVIKVDNTAGLFQLGFTQGGVLGAAFGYFSDYNALIAEASSNNDNPCINSTVNLYSQAVSSATYSWQGPAGFTSTNSNPVIPNIAAVNAGDYILSVDVPGCGTYKDTVHINVLPKTYSTINQSICEGGSYGSHTTTGQFIDNFTGINGCDSIRTLNLTVKPKSFSTFNQSICEGSSFEGHTTSGAFVTTFIAANGCDSIRTLNLTVKPKSFSTFNQSICEGNSFEGHTTSGTYINTYVAANGCDSIRTLNLTVKPKSFSTINQSVCEGASFEGYSITGTYINTFTAANGCDSIRTLNLTVKPKSFSTINQSICEGTSFEGYSTGGTFVNTFTGANGCDSIRTLNLTIKPKSFSAVSQSICEGQAFEGHTTSGTFVTTFSAANGCDSIRTVNLTVKPKSFVTTNQSICEDDSFEGHTASGTYINTYVAANGCDSVRTLNLVIKPKSYKTLNIGICNGSSFEGHNTSGTYINTFTAANGCDSVRTLILTVNPIVTTVLDKIICEGNSYQGHSQAGTYTDTYQSAAGCDSIRTLHLTVNPRSFLTVNKSICEGESYLGFSTAGTYVNTFTAANGCDSIRTLNLTITPKINITTLKDICRGDVFEGHSAGGTYISNYTSSTGCDSIRKLILTVKELPKPYLGKDTAICNLEEKFTITPGSFDAYIWQDGSRLSTYTIKQPGIYTVVVSNICGSAMDDIIVDDKSCNVFFPNVFTPNNDSKNDEFKILNAENLIDYHLVIYNRWGEKVFETTEYNKGWNGTYKDKKAALATYVWYSNFKMRGKYYNLKGTVILIR
jgi:gliding motility-associated-like protein